MILPYSRPGHIEDGLAGQPPLTQLETAQLLQISRSYVSRLETHALEQLRKGWLQESPGE